MEKKKVLLAVGIGCGALLLLAICGLVLIFAVLIPQAKKTTSIDGEETAIEKIVNTVGYAGVKELKTETDQKKMLEDAMGNMANQEEFEMNGTVKEGDQDMEMTVKVKGEDMEMYMKTSYEGTDFSMHIVTKGEYLYYGVNDKGVKLLKDTDTAEEMTSEFDLEDLKESFGDTDWDEGDIEYKGVETVGSKKYHTYFIKSDETTIWIDGMTILPVKAESKDGQEMTLSFKDVEIKEPEGFEDITSLSEEEQGMKIFEILFGSMDFGGYEDDYGYEDEWDWDWEDEGYEW